MAKSYELGRNDALDNFCDKFDGGGTGSLKLYTGAGPAHPEDAATGTLLVSLPLSGTAWGAAVAGVATANAITSTTIGTTGTAGYYRFVNGAGTCTQIGEVTATGGGGDLELDTVSLVAGNLLVIDSFTQTLAEGT